MEPPGVVVLAVGALEVLVIVKVLHEQAVVHRVGVAVLFYRGAVVLLYLLVHSSSGPVLHRGQQSRATPS